MKVLSFIAITLSLATADKEIRQQASQIFTKYDQDENGLLSMEELVNGLSKDMNFQASSKIVKESAEKMLEEHDLDGNGLS